MTGRTFSDNLVYTGPREKETEFQWTWGTVLRPLGEQKSAATRSDGVRWLSLMMSILVAWIMV